MGCCASKSTSVKCGHNDETGMRRPMMSSWVQKQLNLIPSVTGRKQQSMMNRCGNHRIGGDDDSDNEVLMIKSPHDDGPHRCIIAKNGNQLLVPLQESLQMHNYDWLDQIVEIEPSAASLQRTKGPRPSPPPVSAGSVAVLLCPGCSPQDIQRRSASDSALRLALKAYLHTLYPPSSKANVKATSPTPLQGVFTHTFQDGQKFEGRLRVHQSQHQSPPPPRNVPNSRRPLGPRSCFCWIWEGRLDTPATDDRPASRFEGMWTHPGLQRTGDRGTFTIYHNFVYTGQWKEGKMHGNGFLTICGDEYEGDFKDNKIHGQGVYTYKPQLVHCSTSDVSRRSSSGPPGCLRDNHSPPPAAAAAAAAAASSKSVVHSGEWKDGLKDGHGVTTTTTTAVSDPRSREVQVKKGFWQRGQFIDSP